MKKPLQRIITGGVLCSVSFIFAGSIEVQIESEYPVLPEQGMSKIFVMNNSPCQIHINGSGIKSLNAFESEVVNVPMGQEMSWIFTPIGCEAHKSLTQVFSTSSQFESIMVTLQNTQLQVIRGVETKERTKDEEPKIKVFYSLDFKLSHNSSLKLAGEKSREILILLSNSSDDPSKIGMTEYIKIQPGKYKIYFAMNGSSNRNSPAGEVELRSGGIYVATVYENQAQNYFNSTVFALLEPHSISILYQIPQYIFLAISETLFSINGLQFIYSEAPDCMKSVAQAAWLFNVSIGNFITMIIAKLCIFEKKSSELYMFALLMFLDMILFSIMAYFYKPQGESKKPLKVKIPVLNGKTYQTYEKETDLNK